MWTILAGAPEAPQSLAPEWREWLERCRRDRADPAVERAVLSVLRDGLRLWHGTLGLSRAAALPLRATIALPVVWAWRRLQQEVVPEPAESPWTIRGGDGLAMTIAGGDDAFAALHAATSRCLTVERRRPDRVYHGLILPSHLGERAHEVSPADRQWLIERLQSPWCMGAVRSRTREIAALPRLRRLIDETAADRDPILVETAVGGRVGAVELCAEVDPLLVDDRAKQFRFEMRLRLLVPQEFLEASGGWWDGEIPLLWERLFAALDQRLSAPAPAELSGPPAVHTGVLGDTLAALRSYTGTESAVPTDDLFAPPCIVGHLGWAAGNSDGPSETQTEGRGRAAQMREESTAPTDPPGNAATPLTTPQTSPAGLSRPSPSGLKILKYVLLAPVRPTAAKIAEEVGCSHDHARSLLAGQLKREYGVRNNRGYYILPEMVPTVRAVVYWDTPET